ncbi:MAG: hypothetical protein HYZ29_11525 [Myxococcales bacterium]|nr:hypothetical protein [Myxococcales bacterium]
MRIATALAVGFWPALAGADGQPWEPGEATASTVRGEVRGPRQSSGDGVYGRFDGDLDFGFGLGVATASKQALGTARASLTYYSTLGLYAGYADAVGQERDVERFVDLGFELRPLFLLRWSRDAEQGPATVDLVIDSLALGAGAFVAEPAAGDFGATRGVELVAGLGLPLAGNAAGPWLEARYALRWLNPGEGAAARTEHAGLAVLSWHTVFLSGMVE